MPVPLIMETVLYTKTSKGVEARIGYPYNMNFYATNLNEAYHFVIGFLNGRSKVDGPVTIRLIEI